MEQLELRALLSTIYVDQNATSGTPDGTSWNTAYTDLQQALSVAISGDEIRVADGVYKPTSGTDRTISFQMKNGVAIVGGYAGSGATTPDERNVAVYVTTLSGDIGIAGDMSDNSYHVVECSETNPTAVLNGFRVTEGNADGSALERFGGGIYGNNSSAALLNCTFVSNHAAQRGGAAYLAGIVQLAQCAFIDNSAPTGGALHLANAGTIDDCSFLGNSAETGGAVYLLTGTFTVSDCSMTGNSSVTEGGGVVTVNANTNFINCAFVRNTAQSGGAIHQTGQTLAITGCIFRGNVASLRGGAIHTHNAVLTQCEFSGNLAGGGGGIYVENGSMSLTNCTLAGNQAGGVGGAISSVNSTLGLVNCVVAHNTAVASPGLAQSGGTITVNHTAIQGGFSGTNNTSADPGFVRFPSRGPDGTWGSIDDDYGDLRLRISSPGIDAGLNSAVPADLTTDLVGNVRLFDIPTVHDPGAIVDMGAYEYTLPLLGIAGDYLQSQTTPTVTVGFNGDVATASLSGSDLLLTDASSGLPLAGLPPRAVAYDFSRRTARFVFFGTLPDGNYVGRVSMNEINDLKGNGLSADFTFGFFVLAGDANRDRKVDLQDLVILAANWGGSGKTFSQGDFNYDGIVNAADLGILAQRWQRKLDAPLPSAPVPAAAPKRSAVRAPTRIAEQVL